MLTMKIHFPRLLPSALAAAASATVGAATCIVSGNPLAASTERTVSLVSAATSFTTGVQTAPSSCSALEARHRARLASGATSLRSDAPQGSMLIVR